MYDTEVMSNNKRKGIRAAKVKLNFMTALPLSIQYEGVILLHTYICMYNLSPCLGFSV